MDKNERKKIRVCHFTSAHSSSDVRIFHKECVSLAKAGYEVFLVAPGTSREEKGVRVIGVGEKPTKRLQRMTFFARNVYKHALALDCDIYHLHDPELLPYGLKLKRKGKYVIFDSHEFYGCQIREKTYLPSLVRSVVTQAYIAYEKHVCVQIDAVIEICTLAGKDYFENRASRTVMISNVPILSNVALLQNINRPQKKFTIVYAGGLTEGRGIRLLAQAAFETGCELILCGVFQSKDFHEALLHGAYKKCIEYKGWLSQDELEGIYACGDTGAAIMQYVGQNALADTLATKIYEYMMFGLPVITSDFSFARKLIEKYNFGICVKADDIDDIKKGLTYFRNNPQEAKRLGKNGRKAVEQVFNWSIEERKLLSLYDSISSELI